MQVTYTTNLVAAHANLLHRVIHDVHLRAVHAVHCVLVEQVDDLAFSMLGAVPRGKLWYVHVLIVGGRLVADIRHSCGGGNDAVNSRRRKVVRVLFINHTVEGRANDADRDVYSAGRGPVLSGLTQC
jgi:hypothetical protein